MSREPTREQEARINLLSDAHDGKPIAILSDYDPLDLDGTVLVVVAQTGYCWHIDENGNVVESHALHGHPVDWSRLDEDEGVAYRQRIWDAVTRDP